jgi:hypothetical protein
LFIIISTSKFERTVLVSKSLQKNILKQFERSIMSPTIATKGLSKKSKAFKAPVESKVTKKPTRVTKSPSKKKNGPATPRSKFKLPFGQTLHASDRIVTPVSPTESSLTLPVNNKEPTLPVTPPPQTVPQNLSTPNYPGDTPKQNLLIVQQKNPVGRPRKTTPNHRNTLAKTKQALKKPKETLISATPIRKRDQKAPKKKTVAFAKTHATISPSNSDGDYQNIQSPESVTSALFNHKTPVVVKLKRLPRQPAIRHPPCLDYENEDEQDTLLCHSFR